MFLDRKDAGEKLSIILEKFKDENPLILAIPRGGMVTAYSPIKTLSSSWDLIIPRKIPSPYNEEIAIGAVSLDGTYFLNENYINTLNIPNEYIEKALLKQIHEIKRRLNKYKGNETFPMVKNKTVIIIDDGIATGFTLKAAIESIKNYNPKKIILAVPVASQNAISKLEKNVDEIICLCVPHKFLAVSAYYEDFSQTTDEEVINIINTLNQLSPQ